MAGASFEMDLSGLRGMVKRAIRGLGESQELMEAVGEAWVSSTIERFEEGKGPDGTDWKKSSRAEEEGGQTMVKSGGLKGSISSEASPATVFVGTTNEVCGAIHQFGGEIKPRSGNRLIFDVGGRTVAARKVDMPARPYIGISEEDVEEAKEMVRLFMQGAFGL